MGFESSNNKSAEAQELEAKWKEHGSFVPAELRVSADAILNGMGEDPSHLANLPEENRASFVDKLRAYQSVLPGKDMVAEKKKINDQIVALLQG